MHLCEISGNGIKSPGNIDKFSEIRALFFIGKYPSWPRSAYRFARKATENIRRFCRIPLFIAISYLRKCSATFFSSTFRQRALWELSLSLSLALSLALSRSLIGNSLSALHDGEIRNRVIQCARFHTRKNDNRTPPSISRARMKLKILLIYAGHGTWKISRLPRAAYAFPFLTERMCLLHGAHGGAINERFAT